MKGGVKRLYEVDEQNNIINTYINRESIENKLIEFNKAHFTKAYNTIAYKDKVYNQLQNNQIRDKILSGKIKWEDYDYKDVYNFLKLLKQPSNCNQTNVIPIMTEEE